MIINVGTRTDIVWHYRDWLMNRFREGYAYARNPLFPHKILRYNLSPDKVDAVLFCSKNYAPLLADLPYFGARYRIDCQYTITAYGSDIEPNAPDIETSIRTLYEAEKIVGRKRLVWRYDPILLTPRYSAERHLRTFEEIARALEGHVDRCIVRFVEMHVKLQKNLPELIPLTEADKRALMRDLGRIAERYRIPIRVCGNGAAGGEIAREGCVTLQRLGEANGCSFRSVKHNGNRRGCLCIESRDLGWYDSCPGGCRYCYANKDAALVRENAAKHDPASPLLIGRPEEGDELIGGVQRSFLGESGRQLSLFD